MDAKHTLGEPRLQLSAAALLHNVAVVRAALAPGVNVCAVVKADAYGHGVTHVAATLAPVVDAFAVATIEEAAAVGGWGKPVMILRPVENVLLGRNRELIEVAVRSGWTLTLASAAAADDVARVALAAGKQARVQIMLDTGMTRCGASPAVTEELIARVLRLPALKLVALATHLANGEVRGDPFSSEQLKRFRDATGGACVAHAIARHACNSGGLFFSPRGHFDLVRPGISLYGIDPTGRPNVERSLRPVAKWTAPLIALHDVAPGQSIGYGQSYVAERPMRVGIVPVGYADGYARCMSGRSAMTVAGERCPVVGRISMDMTAIDLTRVPDAAAGDEATLLSPDPLAFNSVYGLAAWADTIAYEVFTRIGTRVKRVLIDDTRAVRHIEDAGVE